MLNYDDPITQSNYPNHPIVKNIINNINFPFIRQIAVEDVDYFINSGNNIIFNKIEIQDEIYKYLIFFIPVDFYEHAVDLMNETDLTNIEIHKILIKYLTNNYFYGRGHNFGIPANRWNKYKKICFLDI